jgi:hypothetical protein
MEYPGVLRLIEKAHGGEAKRMDIRRRKNNGLIYPK